MKHGKYSKLKEVKPYKVVETFVCCDGISTQEYFCKTEESAKRWIEFLKSCLPEPNEYYFGTEYKIEFIGSEKYI